MNPETPKIPQAEDLLPDLSFFTSRSSGPGGQNVNKVNSKVTLKFEVARSTALTPEQIALLMRKVGTRLTNEGVLVISAQESRSQLQNKEDALSKLNDLLRRVFTPRKVRKATKPAKSVRQARLKAKKHHGEKKQWRQRPEG
jgi:ribosome-associated protein